MKSLIGSIENLLYALPFLDVEYSLLMMFFGELCLWVQQSDDIHLMQIKLMEEKLESDK
jgi:hypothetical protein